MKLTELIFLAGLFGFGISSTAKAYSPIPLSPTWISTSWTALQLAKSPVFTAKVVSIHGPNSLLVEKKDGKRIVVNLFHTHITGNESSRQRDRQQDALKNFVGYTWYIRGNQNKNNIDGVFITKDGKNANILLVYSGLFDLNTRSIIYTHDKDQIKTKYQYLNNVKNKNIN